MGRVAAIALLGSVAASVAAAAPPGPQGRHVETPTLRMTGERPEPRRVQTAALRMTGMRHAPQTIHTAPLRMTGVPQEEE